MSGFETVPASAEDPAAAHLQVQVRSAADGALAVRLDGELDLATAELLDAVLRQRAGRGVVLDCSGLSFLDCAGLRPIVAANARQRTRHGRLILTHVTAQHRRLLQLAGLEQLLDVAEDEPGRAGGDQDA